MPRTVVIDLFSGDLTRYANGYAVVAVDVIRASTTAVTAVATGRRCFPVPSIGAAYALRARLEDAILAGEIGGDTVPGFDLNNSPEAAAARTDVDRPMILLSSSGTKLMCSARTCETAYVACLRNLTATARQLARWHERVALVGAGSLGEFRKEDQMCCAWIAAGLVDRGFAPADPRTRDLIARWRGTAPSACASGRSPDYLRRTGQLKALAFILSHVSGLDVVSVLEGYELVISPHCRTAPAAPGDGPRWSQ